MKTALVTDDLYEQHYSRQGGIDIPERCQAVIDGIISAADGSNLIHLNPGDASVEDLLRCHSAEYIASVERDVSEGRYILSRGDTDICSRSYEVALRAVGGVLSAVDCVMSGDARNAFCVVRPPGHHAEMDQGCGFCIFNNVAVAARYVQKNYNIERVLIVDWDVHHGNGTQDIFYKDPSVFYFSTHQWPSYPGTGRSCQEGRGRGRKTTMNCPHAIGSGRTEILGSFRGKLVPAMRWYRPEFVMISAGFDSEAGDHVGGFSLCEDDFAEMTQIVMDIAGEYARDRIVSVLEGGYNLDGLGRTAGAHVRTMAKDIEAT